MAGNQYTQDVILDADGKPVLDAFAAIHKEIGRIQKAISGIGVNSVADAKKWQAELAQNIKMLKQAQSDINALARQRQDRVKGFQASEKAARDVSKAEIAADKQANAQKLVEAKVHYRQKEQLGKEAARRIRDEELAGAKIVADRNRARSREEINQAKELKRARLEAAQAGITAKARGMANLDDARLAKSNSDQRLAQLRAERLAMATNDSTAARGLAERIRLEKDLGRALDTNIKKLSSQQEAARRTFTGINTRDTKLLVPADVQQSANRYGVAASAGMYANQQRAAVEELRAIRASAVATAEQRVQAQRNLELANLRVTAAKRLLREEERVVAAQQRQALQSERNAAREMAGANRRTPLQNILTPQYAGAAFARTAIYGAAAGAAYGAFNTVQEGLTNTVALEDEFKKLQAIANASDTQLQNVKASIFAIGETSRFASLDLVKISQTLAQAGVSAADMENVLSSVTTLATASGSTPDEAVNLVTSALGAFQLQASEAARVADLMTVALNRTKLTVQQAGQAIQYVGATAFEQNISLEQMLATVGAIAQAGVKSGSTIGTGFRQFLVDLQSPSKKLTEQLQALGITQADVDVSTRGLSAVLETLAQKGFGSAQAYEGLEVRAAAFYLTAKNNLELMDQLQLSFADQSAAAIGNERAMNSLTAQWQRFKNIIGQKFADNSEDFLEGLKDFLREISDALVEFDDEMAKVQTRLEGGFSGYVDRAKSTGLAAVTEGGYDWFNDNFWDQLTGNQDKASQASESLADKMDVLNDRITTQTGRIGEASKEYQRLLVQKASLINNDQRSAAEMTSLMARFEGLGLHLKNTTNLYEGLTGAVRDFITANQQSLAADLITQRANYAIKGESLRQGTTTAMAAVRNNPGYSKLPVHVRAAIDTLLTKGADTNEFIAARSTIGGAVPGLAKDSSGIGKALNDLVQNLNQRTSNYNLNRIAGTQLKQTEGASSVEGQPIFTNLQQIEALLTKGRSGGKEGERALKDAEAILNRTEGMIGRIVDPVAKAYGNTAKSEIASLRGQLGALRAPTSEEKKAATRAEREAAKRPLVTQRDIDAIGQELGLRLGSGVRTPGEQEALHARGVTPARGFGPRKSNHVGGIARDFGVRGLTDAQAEQKAATIRARLRAQGIEAEVKYERGGKNDGTGRHIHVGVRQGTRKRTDRTAENQDQYAASLAQSQVSLNKGTLRNKLKDISDATSEQSFNVAVAAAEEALKTLNQSLTDEALLDLATAGIVEGSPQYQARMQQVAQETNNNVEDFQQKVTTAIIKSTEAALKQAETTFAAAMQASEGKLAVAEAQASGLGSYSLRGRVPDYVDQLAADRVARAKENVDRATYENLPIKIKEVQGQIGVVQGRISAGTGDVTELNTKLAELNLQMRELVATREALGFQLDAGGLIPNTLGEGLNQAIEAYRNANNLTNTFSQDLTMNLGGAIEQVHSGLTDMFSSVLDGSQSALQAFGNFAKGIMNWITQMVAKFIASKVLDFLFGLITAGGGGGGAGFQMGGSATSMSTISAGRFHGGPVGDDGFLHRAGGGLVANGSKAMDSVATKLAKGEFVMQNKAVDSVGTQFMAKLNQHGAKALDGLNSMPQIDMKTRTETNVYVVPPEQRPTLTKGDVIVYMQDDMLNGDTKRLIQHIVREG